MLPQLTVTLPFDLQVDLPVSLPFETPDLPLGIAEISGALGSSWTWVAGGAVLAVVSLWALRRARRLAVVAAVSITGVLLAWNAGFLPLSA